MRLCIKILNAPEGEKLLTLDPPGGLVGRSPDNALVLGYDSVSRLHAELRHDGKDWWLHHRSQTSATLLDEQLLAVSTPRRLGPHGSMQLGRVVIEYHQQALPATPQPPSEPLPSEVTLVLSRRASVVFPQALLSQMSPVRVDAAPEPASPPPTLTRLPRLPPPVPPAATELNPRPILLRPSRPPPPELDSPPTLIRSNRPLPIPAAAESGPPLTMIRRPHPPPIPLSPTAGPAPLVRPEPSPPAQSGPMAAAQRIESAAAPLVEHQYNLHPAVAPAQLQAERERLRSELEEASAETTRLRRSEAALEAALKEAKAALGAQLAAQQAEKPPSPGVQPTSPDMTELREKALELLQPFGRSLEQVGEALRKGAPEEARALLRSASFALADLRDLFHS